MKKIIYLLLSLCVYNTTRLSNRITLALIELLGTPVSWRITDRTSDTEEQIRELNRYLNPLTPADSRQNNFNQNNSRQNIPHENIPLEGIRVRVNENTRITKQKNRPIEKKPKILEELRKLQLKKRKNKLIVR